VEHLGRHVLDEDVVGALARIRDEIRQEIIRPPRPGKIDKGIARLRVLLLEDPTQLVGRFLCELLPRVANEFRELAPRLATTCGRKRIAIRDALLDLKHRIRARHKFYSQDLINNLFLHPYTKIDLLKDDLGVSRLTATKYLDLLAADGILEKRRIGRSNYYINTRLYDILTSEGMTDTRP
jgi:hypothetical protein